MELKAQDVLLLLKLVCYGSEPWSYAKLAQDLGMSTSMIFASVKRVQTAGLLETGGHPARPTRGNLKEFLIHGAKYVFPVIRGGATRGIPTSYAAPPLNREIGKSTEPPPVWPHPEGKVRGLEFSPIHRNAPGAALKDPKLYELLALLDALRGGRARERELAVRELQARLEKAW
jgi:hypothetical protein